MNRILTLIFFLLILINVYPNTFNGGLSAGTSFSQIDGDRQSGYHKLGLSGGFFVNRNISSIISYQFEIKYIEKGANDTKNIDYKISLKYIQFPLSLRYLYKKKYLFEGGF